MVFSIFVGFNSLLLSLVCECDGLHYSVAMGGRGGFDVGLIDVAQLEAII